MLKPSGVMDARSRRRTAKTCRSVAAVAQISLVPVPEKIGAVIPELFLDIGRADTVEFERLRATALNAFQIFLDNALRRHQLRRGAALAIRRVAQPGGCAAAAE